MRKNTMFSKYFTVILAFITGITVVIAIVLYCRWNSSLTSGNSKPDTVSDNNIIPNEADAKTRYIGEVYYTGGIGYPEVYDYPFKKSDWYITNKELHESDPTIPKIATDTAAAFMEKLLNINYMDIAQDEKTYINDLTAFMDKSWLYNENLNGDSKTCQDLMRQFADYVIENEIAVEGNFITDTSLVYKDGMVYVRGIVEYKVFSSLDKSLPVSDDTKKAMVEIRMHRSKDNVSEYDIIQCFQVPEEQN